MKTQSINLNWDDVNQLAKELVETINSRFTGAYGNEVRIWGVPRGGIHAAQLLLLWGGDSRFKLKMSCHPQLADFIVDDIIDSGETRQLYSQKSPGIPFIALIDKTSEECPGEWLESWIKFPWEVDEDHGPEDNVRRIIQFIGDDPNREGLIETPVRVVKAYKEMFTGYQHSDEDVGKMLKVFTDGSCKEMVIVKDIEFVSFCEHHMLSFEGLASIAYIPNGKIVGLSKLARLLDVYSRRLQVQERLTQQITTALDTHLKPLGSACVIEAKHSCMSCRGVMKQQSSMITSSLTGEFLEKPEVRAEFMSLVRG